MKNWLYLPFLLLMAITYTRLASNYNSAPTSETAMRGPASVEKELQVEECLDLPSQFNPHSASKGCL